MKKVLKRDATDRTGKNYSMRTARCTRATEWYALVTEYRYMKWPYEPPNPLQHESERMTKDHYATKGIDSVHAIQQRCLDKYFQKEGMH